MQLQKHVFLGQGYCLALLDSALYYQNTHAWQWGPVVPKLYKALQQYGSGQVTAEIQADDELEITSDEYSVLSSVWNAYRKFSGAELSALTHREGSPWFKTWNEAKFGVIPLEDIKAYYSGLVASK